MAQPSRVPWLVVTDGPRLILASQSPARRKLLRAAGIDAEVIVSGVDESTVEADRPETLSLVLARMKAEAVATRLRSTERRDENLLVLGCDSVLAFDGAILGKPADAADAIRRWTAMRGRSRRAAHRPLPGRPAYRRALGERRGHHGALRGRLRRARSTPTSPPASRCMWPARSPSTGSARRSSRSSTAITVRSIGLSLPLLRDLLARAGHPDHRPVAAPPPAEAAAR